MMMMIIIIMMSFWLVLVKKNNEELDFMFLISQMLLELREKFNVTTEVDMFVSEKILNKN